VLPLPVGQVTAGHVLDRHPLQPAGAVPRQRAGREHLHDVRAVELAEHQPLLVKAGQQVVVQADLVADQFDGHGPVQAQLRRQVDLTHAAGRQLLPDAEVVAERHRFQLGRGRRGAVGGGAAGIGAGVADVGHHRLRLGDVPLRQVGEGRVQPRAQLVGQLGGGPAVQDAAHPQHDDEIARLVVRPRLLLGGEVSGDLHVFQVEPVRRQRRRDAGDGAGVVQADGGRLERVRGQRPDLDAHRLPAAHAGQQAQVPDDFRGRVALEVTRRQAAEVPLHQLGIQLAALVADGIVQVHHASALPSTGPPGQMSKAAGNP
jgi:hypothetical protein